ncbi:MAG: glycogen synthase GlgA [Candidatus Omnitrophica bacterium]|nr:glycogen synthase GlgA [Candidatus Omnitrophota bacterium]
MEKLKVLFASSEVVPFAKTGGLADVAGSLPIALEKQGVDARVIMPRYASVKERGNEAKIGKNVKVYFVKNDEYFKRSELYGDKFGDYKDNLDRFVFFSRQILERCKAEDFHPDIIHCNDWQTALVPTYLNTLYKYDTFFSSTRTLFTIHNMAYQGLFAREEYPKIGLDWALFNMNYFEFYDKVNLMKGGIVYSDAIGTVSPTYAKEILTPEFGCGLEGVLKNRENSLYGIINGVDYDLWDPATDDKLYKKYSQKTFEDKYVNKAQLQKDLGLKVDSDIPVIGIVSRLADQKGLDLLADIIDSILNMKVQFVLLGTGDNKYHVLFEKIAKKYPRNSSIHIKFDAILAQRIYAASDLFLIPSRYEPCGLGQMISFKYGAIPVVRQTGGLKDTVKEYDLQTGKGNGFTFVEPRSRDFLAAIKKALLMYNEKEAWAKLVRNVMGLDFSWENSAKEYVKLYKKILK